MKQRNTVRHSRNRLPMGKTDWAQVNVMTDKEILRGAAGDPDTRLTTPHRLTGTPVGAYSNAPAPSVVYLRDVVQKLRGL